MFNDCKYIISTTSRTQSPNTTSLPEFIFLGRSNVGKSSFINALASRKMLAKISSKPGKTITINYFLIDNEFYLCDAPGYGYASRSMSIRNDFGNYIEDYLNNNPNLKVVFLLVDLFVGPTKDDVLMYDYLRYYNLNIVIIATKSDKVGKTRQTQHLNIIKNKLKNIEQLVIKTSASKKEGLEEVKEIISKFIK